MDERHRAPKAHRPNSCRFGRDQNGWLALKAKESKPTNKSSLTAQPPRLVDPTLDARHGFTHFTHTDEGRAVLTARESKATAVDLSLSRFGCQKRILRLGDKI